MRFLFGLVTALLLLGGLLTPNFFMIAIGMAGLAFMILTKQ